MSTTLLAGLLWLPFGIVAVIAGVIFLNAGYKQGLWRALISTGATVVATLVSMLLAKLLAIPLSGAVLNILPDMGGDGQMSAELLETFVNGIVGVALSLALFSLLLLIFSIVLKLLSNRIQHEKLAMDKDAFRWAGMGVRLVDTVLFAVLLALPLYGTIATYVPTAQGVVQMQDAPESVAETYLETISSHPVVQMSGVGPAQCVYTGLSDVQMSEGSVNIADMAQTVDGVVRRVEKIAQADPAQVQPQVQELVQYLRINVVEKPWCYDLYQEVMSFVESSMREGIVEEEQAMVDEFLGLFRMDQEQFKANGTQVLDFVGFVLQSVNVENEEAAEAFVKSAEFCSRFGALMNSTDQAIAGKNLMLRLMIQEDLFDGDVTAASAFMAGRFITQPTPADQQAAEGEAWLMLMDGADREEKLDALEKLPCFRFTAADRELIPEEPVYDYFDEYYDGAFSGVIGEDGQMTVVTPDGDYGYISGDGTITIIKPDGEEAQEDGGIAIIMPEYEEEMP